MKHLLVIILYNRVDKKLVISGCGQTRRNIFLKAHGRLEKHGDLRDTDHPADEFHKLCSKGDFDSLTALLHRWAQIPVHVSMLDILRSSCCIIHPTAYDSRGTDDAVTRVAMYMICGYDALLLKLLTLPLSTVQCTFYQYYAAHFVFTAASYYRPHEQFKMFDVARSMPSVPSLYAVPRLKLLSTVPSLAALASNSAAASLVQLQALRAATMLLTTPYLNVAANQHDREFPRFMCAEGLSPAHTIPSAFFFFDFSTISTFVCVPDNCEDCD